jgi:hypothetical protein
MDKGYPKDAPLAMSDKLRLLGCYPPFFSTNGCDIRYGGAQFHGSYISVNDEHVLCVDGNAEKGTGARIWGIVAE